MNGLVRIATRGSKLALWQAEHVRALLQGEEPALRVELVILKTTGDKILDRPLAEVGGKGLFVKEIEEAVADGRADLAVHSMKDLPAEVAPGLEVLAVPPREDPRDALLVRAGLSASRLAELPQHARVGTSSLRRMCQLRAVRPDLEVVPLRGNVDTRLRRLGEGAFDAIVLAAAGLRRLGLAEHIRHVLEPGEMLPAIGQGALAIEGRCEDAVTRVRLGRLDHPPTAVCVAAERAFLGRLGGGCRTPLAAHAVLAGTATEGRIVLTGLVGRPDGSEVLHDRIEGAVNSAAALGVTLAEQLLGRGAERILAECAAIPPAGAP
jgi:hydroxymethylbilane synthase